MKTMNKNLLLIFWLGMSALILAACGGGNSNTESDTPSETLEESLNKLGVDTEITPRLDENENIIDDSYAPMGRTISVSRVDNGDGTSSLVHGVRQELFLAGIRTQNCLDNNCLATLIDDSASTPNFNTSPTILYQRTQSSPWINENLAISDLPETLRDATGADIDGDGRSEILIVYFDASLDEVHVSIADSDAPDAPVEDLIIPLTSAQFPVTDLRITTGNFDTDIEEEFAIGIGSHSAAPFDDARAHVFILDGKSRNYALLNSVNIPVIDQSRSVSLTLKSAQLDYDGAMELVVVQNETGPDLIRIIDPNFGAIDVGDIEAFYTIFDNTAGNITELKSGYIEASVEIPAGSTAQIKRAHVADVAVGDFDNDTLDEIFFTGLTGPTRFQGCYPRGHVLISLDDNIHNLDTLSEAFSEVYLDQCPEFDPWDLRFAHINLLDIDGDSDLEIQVNQFIFDSPPTGTQDWYSATAYTPQNRLLFRDNEGRAFFDRTNSVITVGDVTGDGRDNIISYLQGNNEISIYGFNEANGAINRLTSTVVIPGTETNLTRDRLNPIIVPMNTDKDTTVYGLTRYIYTIMEPIVLGVLAAPPCQIGVGQNLDDCTTTWGQASTMGISRERGFEVSASASLGLYAETQGCAGVVYSQCATQFAAEVKATIDVALTKSWGRAYELTKSIAFTTGPLEDSVVFTVVPVDTYFYTMLNQAEEDDRNIDLVVTLPREPTLSMTQISFYNNSVHDESNRIPENVFHHIGGDISSYPTADDKDYILANNRSQLEQVRFDFFNPVLKRDAPLDALEGLEVGPISVGQGSGSTEIGMDLFSSSDISVTNEVGFTFSAEVIAGPVLFGYTAGISGHKMLTVSKGLSTSYYGAIGSIDADNYTDNQYQFGLFTYLATYPDNGREFEVINFWVE